jgi:hypothetical protein
MKKTAYFAAFIALPLAVFGASSSAFAQEKTRAQVYQELIQAEQNGLNYVTDTSYPEVNPIFAQQVGQHHEALATEAAASRVANDKAAAATTN